MTDQIPPDLMNAMRVILQKAAEKPVMFRFRFKGFHRLDTYLSSTGDDWPSIDEAIMQLVTPEDLLPKPVNGPDGEEARVTYHEHSPTQFKIISGRFVLYGRVDQSKAELINEWNEFVGGRDE